MVPRWSGLAAGYGDLNSRTVWCHGDEAGRPLGDIAQSPCSGVDVHPISVTYRTRNDAISRYDNTSLDRLCSRKSRLVI